MVDAAFGFKLGSEKSKKTYTDDQLEKLQEKGVDELIQFLERNGGSVQYAGSVSNYFKYKLKTPYAKINTGVNGIVRLAREQGKIKIESVKNSTDFVMRLCG